MPKRKQGRIKKDRRSPKKRRQLKKKKDSLAWAIAKMMTQRKVVVPDWYRHGDWCYDVFGKVSYCRDCYYNGCIKEVK